jgi:hypothetical protein
MQRRPHPVIPLLTLSLVVAVAGCAGKKKGAPSNEELLAEFDGSGYEVEEQNPTAGPKEDEGSITPQTMAAIDTAITTTYVRDFEKCLEKEMERLENRWVAGTFTVEIDITTKGAVDKIKILELDVKERKTKPNAEPRNADNFGPCIEAAMKEWEFDPPPEVYYTHTHTGRVGEAW